MKTIERLEVEIEKIGGTIAITDYSIHLDAPSGYVWRANGLPALTIHYGVRGQTWLSKAVKMERDGMRMGLEKVTDAGRVEEIRFDLDDDTWGAPESAPAKLEFLL